MNYLIVTNNPLVQANYPEKCVIHAENYIAVLTITRDYIHKGAKLLSHPQAGSIKPYETPYRSILISKDLFELDFHSLQYIESAIERFESLSKSMGLRDYDQETLKDFQVIDVNLIKNAI